MKKDYFDTYLKSTIFLGMVVGSMGFFTAVGYLLNKDPTPLSRSVFAEVQGNVETLVTEAPRPVYLLPIQDCGVDGFARKRDAFVAGQIPLLELTEAEVNAWLCKNFTPMDDPSIKERPFALLPSLPKVSFYERYLQLLMDLKVMVSGEEYSAVFSATGEVSERNGVWKLTASEGAFANARFPGADILASFVADFFKAVFVAAPEYKAVQEFWSDLSLVEISNGVVRIHRAQ